MANADVAWIDVLPSARQFLPKLNEAVQPAARSAGESAGRQFGSSFGSTSTNAVEAASTKMSAALRKVQDAAGQVQVQEAKLQALRDKGVTDAGRIAAAEEGVARARRAEVSANEGLTVATRNVAAAQDQHARSTTAAGAAIQETEKKAGILSRTFGSLHGAVITGFAAFAAARAATQFVGDTIKAASDLNEEVNKSTVVFGSQSKAVLDWSKNSAQAFGQSQREALGAAGSFGNLFRTIGLTDEASASMSMKLVVLASDLASFNNADPSEVLEAMRAGLVGETEPMRRFGVDISDASMRAEALKEGLQVGPVLTQAQKAQLAYALILKQTTLAQGDFQRTSDGLANSQRILSAGWEDSKAKLGALLIGPMTAVVHWISGSLVPWLGQLGDTARQVFSILFKGDFVGGGWLSADSPIVATLFNVRDAFKSLWGFLTGSVFPALQAFGGFVLQNREWLGPLAGLILGVVAAARIWVGVQLLLNAAVSANPIGFVLNAIRLLVIAFATAWASSETFRNIVTGVLKAVGDAGVWLWDHALKPAFDAIVTAWNAVVGAVQWAWANVLQPTWNAVSTAAQWLWNNVLSPAFTGISAAWSAMVTAIQWAWDHILNPIWEVIKAAAQVLLIILGTVIFGPIAVAWTAMTTAIEWAWNNILHPAWVAIEVAAHWLWENVLRPIWDAMQFAWNALLTAFKWAWDNILHPVWDAISTAANWLWNTILAPIFQAIGAAWDGLMRGIRWVYDNVVHPMWQVFTDAINALKRAFDVVVQGISQVWNTIMDIVATPINFVIEIVFNRGLFTAWNWIVDHLGLPKDWHAPHWDQLSHGVHFAQGGRVPGVSPSKTADNIPAYLTAGEFVQPVDSTRYYGVDAMEAIRNRKASILYAEGGLIPGFAAGGLWTNLENLRKQLYPGSVLTSAVRPGAPDLHGAGDAIDIGWPGNLQSQLDRIGADVQSRYPRSAEIIHNPTASTKNGQRVPPSFWGAATWAAHADHVHWAITDLAQLLGGATGSATATVDVPWYVDLWHDVTGAYNWFKDHIKAVGEMVSRFGDNQFVQMVAKAPVSMLENLWGVVKDKIAALFLAGQDRAPGDTGGIKSDVSAIAQNYGWQMGTPYWAGIDYIVSHESGWNPKAQNPTSSASGLFQMVDGTWAAMRPIAASSVAHAKDARVVEQAQAGLKYMATNRNFHNPLQAQAFWAAHHYYGSGGLVDLFDRGGIWRHGHLGINLSGDDERVWTAPQDDYFQRFVRATESGEWGGGKRMLAETINVHGRDADDIIDRLWHKVRVADRGGVYTFTA